MRLGMVYQIRFFMKTILKGRKLIPLDNVYLDKKFKPIGEFITTHGYHTDAITKFSYYPRPVGYENNNKCYILGQNPSVDAAIALNQDEIEVDVINSDVDVQQFMAVFLSKENLHRKARMAYIKMVSDYLKTPDGKKWASESFQTKDVEGVLAQLTGKSCSNIKKLLKLIKPQFNKEQEKYGNYEISLFEAYNNCNAKEKKTDESSKPSSNSPVDPIVTKSPAAQPAAEESKKSVEEQGNPDLSDNVPINKKVKPKSPSSNITQTITAADAIDQYGPHRNVLPASNEFIRKAILELEDGQTIEVTGRITLNIDGNIIASTENLHKLENGNWSIPATCKTYNLLVLQAA